MDSPSSQLAARIVGRLIEEKLLEPKDRARFLGLLSDGLLKAEDWRLAIELAASKKGMK